jgi:hypothetical protein
MKAAVILKKIQVRATAKWQTLLFGKNICVWSILWCILQSSHVMGMSYSGYRFKVVHLADNVLAPGA